MICNNVVLDCGNAALKHGIQRPDNGARGRATVQLFTYVGDDKECTICLEKLYRDERVYRLTCNR
eukprot:3614812-Lingulodinium_polyedra.AAC.1